MNSPSDSTNDPFETRALTFIPPLIGPGIVFLFCVWVIVSDTIGPVRRFDGQPDDAPRMAAVFIAGATPFLFFLVLALNVWALKISKGRPSRFVTVYLGALFVCTAVMSTIQPNLREAARAFIVSAFFALALLAPSAAMGVWLMRRAINTRSL